MNFIQTFIGQYSFGSNILSEKEFHNSVLCIILKALHTQVFSVIYDYLFKGGQSRMLEL